MCLRFRCGCLASSNDRRLHELPFVASSRLPDPRIRVLDEQFLALRLLSGTVERLATGFYWAEGPQWFGDGRYLLFSDIPNNRILRWDETTGGISDFRRPSKPCQRPGARPPGTVVGV